MKCRNCVCVCVFLCSMSFGTRSAEADYPPNEIVSPATNDVLPKGAKIQASGTGGYSPYSGLTWNWYVRVQVRDANNGLVLDELLPANVFEYCWNIETANVVPNAAAGGSWFITLLDYVDTDSDTELDTYFELDSANGAIGN